MLTLSHDSFFTQANERIALFVDHATHTRAETAIMRTVVLREVIRKFNSNAKLVTARYYILLPKGDRTPLHKKADALQFGGFQVHNEYCVFTETNAAGYPAPPMNRSLDARMSVDMVELILKDKVDHIVYLGSSLDMIPAFQVAKANGVRITVAGTALSPDKVQRFTEYKDKYIGSSYRPTTPPNVRAASDHFVELSSFTLGAIIKDMESEVTP